MYKAGWKKEAETFAKAALASSKTNGERALIAELPYAMGKRLEAVVLAKEAAYYGVVLPHVSYPRLEMIPGDTVDPHLTHGIIRQESNFDRHAVSTAGARGLMQLMPATAKLAAKKLKHIFQTHKLHDPHYNTRLGVHYFDSLLQSFDGSTILAIAAYNAGPGNARKWINIYGDPRTLRDSHNAIDWIESIPFMETRDYVHRVLSNAEVYRALARKSGEHKVSLVKEMLEGHSLTRQH